MEYKFKQAIDTVVMDNPIDDGPRKIREKSVSLTNTLKNRINVPIKMVATEKEYNVEEETKEAKIEDNIKVEQTIDNVFAGITENNNTYTVDESISKPVEKPTEVEIKIEPVPFKPITSLPTGNKLEETSIFDEITMLNDKLNISQLEEKELQENAERKRIELEEAKKEQNNAEKELAIAIEEARKMKEQLEKEIEESNKRKEEYSKTTKEIDNEITSTNENTNSLKERIAYIRTFGNKQEEPMALEESKGLRLVG